MQELATKLSRSFDMKEETGNLLGDNMRRHQVQLTYYFQSKKKTTTTTKWY